MKLDLLAVGELAADFVSFDEATELEMDGSIVYGGAKIRKAGPLYL